MQVDRIVIIVSLSQHNAQTLAASSSAPAPPRRTCAVKLGRFLHVAGQMQFDASRVRDRVRPDR